MVSVGTKLRVVDNSGALYAYCIKLLGFPNGIASIGERLVVVIKRAVPNKKIKAHEVRLALLIYDRHDFKRNQTGVVLRFAYNGVLILDGRFNPIATRIKGMLPQEFRLQHRIKFLLMAHGVF